MENNIKEELKNIEEKLKDKRPWYVKYLMNTGLIYIALILMFLYETISTQSQSFLISTIGYLFGLVGIIGFIHFRRIDRKLNLLIQFVEINTLLTNQVKESVDGHRMNNHLPGERWTDELIKKNFKIYRYKGFNDRKITLVEKKIWDLFLVSNKYEISNLMLAMLLNKEVNFYYKRMKNYELLVIKYDIFSQKQKIIIVEPEESIFGQLDGIKSYKINGDIFLHKSDIINHIKDYLEDGDHPKNTTFNVQED